MRTTDNYRKHTSSNRLQRWFIEQFYMSMRSALTDSHPRKVLDAGCGEGFSLERLRAIGVGESLVGVDYSRDAVTFGKQLFPALDLRQGDIYRLPFADHTFDLVLCNEVLEHLEDPVAALAELRRVGKGEFLFSVPHEPWFRMANLLRGKNISRLGDDRDHRNHWTGTGFVRFLRHNGYTPRLRLSPFPWTMVLARVEQH